MFHSHMRFYVTQWSGTRFYGSLIVCNRPLPLKKVTPWQPSENHLLAILVLFEIRLPANPNEPPWQILRPPWITPSSICLILHRAIPENIHTIPRTASRISEGEGGFTIMEF